jgi:hypothetical protein
VGRSWGLGLGFGAMRGGGGQSERIDPPPCSRHAAPPPPARPPCTHPLFALPCLPLAAGAARGAAAGRDRGLRPGGCRGGRLCGLEGLQAPFRRQRRQQQQQLQQQGQQQQRGASQLARGAGRRRGGGGWVWRGQGRRWRRAGAGRRWQAGGRGGWGRAGGGGGRGVQFQVVALGLLGGCSRAVGGVAAAASGTFGAGVMSVRGRGSVCERSEGGSEQAPCGAARRGQPQCKGCPGRPPRRQAMGRMALQLTSGPPRPQQQAGLPTCPPPPPGCLVGTLGGWEVLR